MKTPPQGSCGGVFNSNRQSDQAPIFGASSPEA